MTSNKRTTKLSLDNVDTIDKETCLSSYKLGSISKISSILNEENSHNFKVANLIFGDSDEGSSLKKDRLNFGHYASSNEVISSGFNSEYLKEMTGQNLRFKDQILENDLDANELFDNFDKLVKVELDSVPKKTYRDMLKSDSKINKREINTFVANEAEKNYWAVQGVKHKRNCSEDTIKLSKNLMWYLKQTANNLQPLKEINAKEYISNDSIKPRRIKPANKGKSNDYKEAQNRGNFSFNNNIRRRSVSQKSMKAELTIENNPDDYLDGINKLNNRGCRSKKTQFEFTSNSSYRNKLFHLMNNDKAGHSNPKSKMNKPILGDIISYDSHQEDILYKNNRLTANTKKFDFTVDMERNKRDRSIADNRQNLSFKIGKEKTEQLSENLFEDFQPTVLKDSKAFPEAPRHSSQNKKELTFLSNKKSGSLNTGIMSKKNRALPS